MKPVFQPPCYWNNNILCENGRMCDGCKHQPAPDDKKNGKAPPLPLEWEPDFEGRGMGWPICPACGEMPYSTERCVFCGQQFIQDETVKAYNAPPEEIRMDCFKCGGKGTVTANRTNSNGHLRWKCEACGSLHVE